MPALQIPIDRGTREPIAEQISAGLRTAIRDGRLPAGARLPSWRDLAAQLGVARGTVRAAYETLIDEQLAVALGAAGTHVARRLPPQANARTQAEPPARDPFADYPRSAGLFQMGVPAQDVFPTQVWSRILVGAARLAASAPLDYPDPRGEPALRAAIAASLALTRGLACNPAQIFVTTGYAASLSLAVRTLGLAGGTAWVEDPGYPTTRKVLARLGVRLAAVPVDAQGLDVAAGEAIAPGAALAVVTPGQQAPLGVTLSPPRREALLAWSARSDGWIVEDDYLSEMQIDGRAAPSIAAADPTARVLHIGTFSKTITPALRLGFLVVPASHAARFADEAAGQSAAPAPMAQHAVAAFIQGGHYLRHLRRMKRLYAQRRDALGACLAAAGVRHHAAGLAVLMQLPAGMDDVAFAREARLQGMAPVPLSPWHASPTPANAGLLLGVTNLREDQAAAALARLRDAIARFG
ncbi:GntR family transcriptional regulator [Rhodoferax koreense]|uniref:GntR family transcriptional regulator n=1 Tax=Rhodoferax koreensis TaxID=1842727 RepID=A0A1P8JSQ2_9BURK|nr:PLP-dependent aminotransferase family protein [Rhodoferax koreense]APW36770.1 GntR family transcriptional regulator [Rhodoferax koreense]